jgi:hypothetical protein
MGLNGLHNQTYDQILERGKNRNYKESKTRGTSAQKASKKKRNKLN